MMDEDFVAAFDQVTNSIQAAPSVSAGMKLLIDFCGSRAGSPVREALHSLDYEQDVARLQEWLAAVLSSEPPPENIRAFWFGLYEATLENGEGSCILYVSGSPRFDTENMEWACWSEDSYVPQGRYADSAVLRDIYQSVARESDTVAEIGSYTLCLGYAGLALSRICQLMDPPLLLGASEHRYVAVGWDAGDCIVLGSVSQTGWRPWTA